MYILYPILHEHDCIYIEFVMACFCYESCRSDTVYRKTMPHNKIHIFGIVIIMTIIKCLGRLHSPKCSTEFTWQYCRVDVLIPDCRQLT